MIFSYSLLQSFFREKLPNPEELANLLTLRAFETVVGQRKENDVQLIVDILPNRPDCLSHWGLAREIGAILNLKPKELTFPPFKTEKVPQPRKLKVLVRNKKDCPRYLGRIVQNAEVLPSPSWLKEILSNCEISQINNVVDVTNYVMVYLGQPMHAFDLDKVEGKIEVRRAKKGEKILTLDNKEYTLDPEILVIADKKGPLAIAGIKGGKRAEISERTKNIFLESANFDPILIKKASQKLNLETEASKRFGMGLDPNLAELGMEMALGLISELCGGIILKEKFDFYPQKVLPQKIELSLPYFERLVGISLEFSKIKTILKNLGFRAKRKDKTTLWVLVPTFRQDVKEPEDIIEEIVRIFGLENIPPQLPQETLVPPKFNENYFWEEKAKDALKECGLWETKNYSFLSEADQKIFKIPNLIKAKNPPSQEFAFLRNSLVPSLLKAVKKQEKDFPEMKIFELGKVFIKEGREIKEKRSLAGMLVGKEKFFEAKGVLSCLCESFGIASLWFDFFKPTPEGIKNLWDVKKSAEVKVGDKEIGFLGKIKNEVLTALKIQNEVYAFEIDFEWLQTFALEENEFEEIPKYPAAVRDLSVWVPPDTLSEEVIAKIYDVAPDFLRDVDLFDIYETEDRKSFAFHLIFQSSKKTLTSEELNLAMKKIHEELEKVFGWEVRK